jgi:hypothetical protein
MRSVFVSLAVNATYPSPATSDRVEAAPAFQPDAAVFVRLFPETDTPTASLHETASPAGGGGGGGGVVHAPEIDAPVRVAPGL